MVSGSLAKYKWQYSVLCILVFSCLYLWLSRPALDIAIPHQKTLRFTYTLKNTSNELIDNADFMAMIPADIVGAQQIDSITANENYTIINGQSGGAPSDAASTSIKFNIQNFPPFASKIISITMVLTTDSQAKEESMWRKKYLQAQQYIEVDDPLIVKIAAQTANKVPELMAKSAYEWLANNIKYEGYISENKGAKFALEQRLGDCTEYMYAFIALARANGVPARGVAGFVVPNSSGLLNAADYHNWAEFYDGKKWILVDPQQKVFDGYYENYIATRYIGIDTDTTISTNRFLTTDKRISISF